MIEAWNGTSFSEALKKVNHIAQAYAKENMHAQVSPPHLLKALLHKDAGLQPLLKSLDKDYYYIEEWADVRMESLPKASRLNDVLVADDGVKAAMEEADTIRLMSGSDYLEPVHALAAISTPGVGFTYDQLKTFPLQRAELLQEVTANEDIKKSLSGNGVYDAGGSGALLKYCTHKNARVKEGKLDPIAGRDKEVRAISEILSRRSKPNVLIIGEPGVGKSALVDGFTQAIEQKKVPHFLETAQVFELDNGALAAGASYKGEIEDRLKSIIKEIKAFDKAVLFIDELHVLTDKGGAMAGAANLLKPELARGELTVIGATTREEYRKHIEKDEAFARRFDVIALDEPNAEAAFRMLQIIVPKYSSHHAIEIKENTIHEAIRLAKRYIKDRRLPDSAIDLIDHSMAALRLTKDTGKSVTEEMKEVFREWMKDTDAHSIADWQWHYLQLRNRLSPILWAAVESEDDPMQMKEIGSVTSFLQRAYERLATAVEEERSVLTNSDVIAVVAHKVNIPIGKVQAGEKERLMNMSEVLKQRVIGQDHAIRSVSEAVLESRAGLGKPGQPVGSFFFLGPTGTGKTELAKALADFLFGDESSMIRFDMSEFKEEHSAALLIGAPPGYVGYEEGGLLINRIRQKPYSVVLFDEIEKAHSSVFDIFLQIMDEGRLHDKLGKEGDFSHSLVIFTSNIGSQFVADSFHNHKIPASNELMEIMSRHFRPEFLGRLTEILPFAPITEDMVQRILNIQLRNLHEALEKQGITLSITDKAKKKLGSLGYAPQYGARPLAGVLRTYVRRPLSKKMISGEIGNDMVKPVLDADEEGNFVWGMEME